MRAAIARLLPAARVAAARQRLPLTQAEPPERLEALVQTYREPTGPSAELRAYLAAAAAAAAQLLVELAAPVVVALAQQERRQAVQARLILAAAAAAQILGPPVLAVLDL